MSKIRQEIKEFLQEEKLVPRCTKTVTRKIVHQEEDLYHAHDGKICLKSDIFAYLRDNHYDINEQTFSLAAAHCKSLAYEEEAGYIEYREEEVLADPFEGLSSQDITELIAFLTLKGRGDLQREYKVISCSPETEELSRVLNQESENGWNVQSIAPIIGYRPGGGAQCSSISAVYTESVTVVL